MANLYCLITVDYHPHTHHNRLNLSLMHEAKLLLCAAISVELIIEAVEEKSEIIKMS